MASKRERRERPHNPSFEDEALTENRFDKCPTLIGYNSVEAFCRVTGKYFETLGRLSSNQLTLSCQVLHNIIVHIIVPRKGHLDEVNHFDLFFLDSTLVGRKVDFSYIMLSHMNTIHHGHRVMALPYGMIFTKIFHHFKVSFHDDVALNPKPSDTTNILTLKRMRIFKEDGQWVAKTKGFDAESGSFTLPFDDGEEMDESDDDEDVLLPSYPRPSSHRPSSSTFGFSFTEDHYVTLQ
ncbi:Uncharacterized protein Adt_18488 [Abeliophyllum distichum]|uniref:Uncharacterized protein n=1 Tax=Abeliophyllum distichum TaxID=126358 RepID=A0ABD1TJV6_9LAMI